MQTTCFLSPMIRRLIARKIVYIIIIILPQADRVKLLEHARAHHDSRKFLVAVEHELEKGSSFDAAVAAAKSRNLA